VIRLDTLYISTLGEIMIKATEGASMELLPLTVACPGCGSEDVVYSCDPDCCFNHVCSSCLHNFELFTEDLGEKIPLAGGHPPEKDSCMPTVACALCQSLNVYQLAVAEGEARKLVCVSCLSLLRLGFSFD